MVTRAHGNHQVAGQKVLGLVVSIPEDSRFLGLSEQSEFWEDPGVAQSLEGS